MIGSSSELLAEIEKLLSLSLSNSPTQSEETIDAFEKNKHKLKSKTKQLKADKPKNKGQSLLSIFEDKDLGNAGDFRSQDCIELLKQSDIVVTNPPFSLFREYVSQLVEYKKKFLIIMPLNAITYKEIFKFIRDNKLWLGYGFKSGNAYFEVNGKSAGDFASGVYDEETGLVKFRNVTWGTNLDIKKRHEILETINSYVKHPEKYPEYDNYDAINVDKVVEIPMDYDGVMGVPITFLDIYNPEQFEIIDINPHFFTLVEQGLPKIKQLTLKNANKKDPYARILIKKRPLQGAHSVGSKPSEDRK
nr:adenine-specific methyltransferase EcoRI family protein [Brachyspira aalborgi]